MSNLLTYDEMIKINLTKPEEINGNPAVILGSYYFDLEHHRIIDNVIDSIEFVVIESDELNNEFSFKTNLFWRKCDFVKSKQSLTKDQSYDLNRYRQIGFRIVLSNYYYEYGYHLTLSFFKEILATNKYVKLTNVLLSMIEVYGRSYLEITFKPIILNGFKLDTLRYRLYEHDVSCHTQIAQGLMVSLGANVRVVSDKELAQEQADSHARWKEWERRHEERKAKEITPEKAREIVRLRDTEKLSYARIALIYKVSASTIKSHYLKSKSTAKS